MRLGISANRTHQSTPTEYMLNVADELGFMLIPESPIRGKGRQKWHDEYLPRSVRELAIVSRNHPSVCRYSLMNESRLEWIPSLVDAIRGEDPTRPLVFEDNEIDEPARIEGTNGHAYAMLHYVNYPKPARIITGMGEYAWRGAVMIPRLLMPAAGWRRSSTTALRCGGGTSLTLPVGTSSTTGPTSWRA